MKTVNLKDWLVQLLIALPHDTVVFTSQRWRDSKKHKLLLSLKRLGYFKQTHRFRFVRTKDVIKK